MRFFWLMAFPSPPSHGGGTSSGSGHGTDGKLFGPTKFPDVPWPEALVVPPPWEGGDGKAINQKKRTTTTASEAGTRA